MPSGNVASQDAATSPKTILGLLAASFAFLFLFTSSAVPIPLYSEYRVSIGLTDAAISIAMVSYLVGVCGVLFVAGSISDAIGYRASAVIGLVLGIGGCLIFSQVGSVPMLFAARFCQGLSCGMAMSAISAWIIGTYFQSFSAIVALGCSGVAAPLAGSCILALSVAPSAFGGPVEARMRSGLSLRVSMVALAATTALMCLFMALRQFVPFFWPPEPSA